MSTKLTRTISASVPCRIDFGGTLDITTFNLPMAHLEPASFNIALDMRTHVTLSPHKSGWVKISSRGFETAEFEQGRAPYDHPMGLMFACAQYFNLHGIHIHIESTSPPKSALGGSSSAAVAILAAIFTALEKEVDPLHLTWLAHYIESSVAGVPCGVQDQAAAAFGGVNLWQWKMERTGPGFDRVPLYEKEEEVIALNSNILVAYCGIPHVSKNVNKQWVDAFIQGDARSHFEKIVQITKKFHTALGDNDFSNAAHLMNQETRLRLELTPDVLDKTGKKLFERAWQKNCGARFTGAGGGGCVWAVGKSHDIEILKQEWQDVVSMVNDAAVLDTEIDSKGIVIL
ncbi:MAG: galactokinase [Desulfobacterales bacterium]|nr:galactokinase [Desulfobacterales bacterium]